MLNKLYNLVLVIRSIPKTLFFNFKYLPFKEAIKTPIIISHRVRLSETNGEIVITDKIETGMIKMGFGDVGIFDSKNSRSIWNVKGKVIFNGRANLGHGAKISVNKKGVLTLGKSFTITAESTIVCNKEISFGNDCLISWDNLFMDTDFHKIENTNGDIINQDQPIIIGNKVWFGCRCLILKGTQIGHNNVIGANSLLSKKIIGSDQIIAGNPVGIIKKDVSWKK